MPVLQCGHDPKVVENAAAEEAVAEAAAAMLQCGHDPKVVENPDGTENNNALNMLQCGHDPKVVENICNCGEAAPNIFCFNAATTRRSWRTSARSDVPQSP